MNDLMIDIETMGTDNNSAIISIGAVFFNKEKIGREFYKIINLQSNLDVNLVINEDTVIWWEKQSLEAKKEFSNITKAPDLTEVLNDFINFIKEENQIKKIKPWGNGAAFDIPILENAFKQCNLEIPWKYYNVKCFRTLKSLFKIDASKIKPNVLKHHSLNDAKYQAKYAQEIFKKYNI